MAKHVQEKYRLVFVEWEDSFVGTSGWRETDGAQPNVAVVYSVGWLVHNGKDCKLIVPHLSEPDHANAKQQGCGDITIPASAIRRIVDLTPAKPKRLQSR
jgi:hypothetical protein